MDPADHWRDQSEQTHLSDQLYTSTGDTQTEIWKIGAIFIVPELILCAWNIIIFYQNSDSQCLKSCIIINIVFLDHIFKENCCQYRKLEIQWLKCQIS